MVTWILIQMVINSWTNSYGPPPQAAAPNGAPSVAPVPAGGMMSASQLQKCSLEMSLVM